MKITDNFYLQELLISDFAARKNISNVPSVQHKDNFNEQNKQILTSRYINGRIQHLNGYNA